MKLQGKRALVTGAGSGIGRATALAFAREGAAVALLGRTVLQLEEVSTEAAAYGVDAVVLQADVSAPEEMRAALEQLGRSWDGLDILFANAGINGVWAPIDELTAEEWDLTMNINVKGIFLTLKYALPLLRKGLGASVIFDASVNGTTIFSAPGATAYSCSKAAIVALAKASAVELAKDHIRVNAVCPGWVKTEIRSNTTYRHRERLLRWTSYPEGKPPLTRGEPLPSDAIARTVLHLASEDAAFITGAVITIDGGESLI